MASELGNLPRLEDYAFLSDPTGQEVFLIERDGRIWLQTEQPGGLGSREREEATLLRLQDYSSGTGTWAWLGGWLPILVVDGGDAGRIELLAEGESLLLSTGEKAWRFPGERPVSASEFEAVKARIRDFWTRWLAAGRNLPQTHPYLDRAWRASLVQAKMTYSARHPHYGVGGYGRSLHDGFPPTTLTTADCLLEFDHAEEALILLGYFLDRFVCADGQIDYYGVALAEYGGFLTLFARLAGFDEGRQWLYEYLPVIRRILALINRKRIPRMGGHPLLIGSPEADTRGDVGIYFHNAAQIWRGMIQWAHAAEILGEKEMAMEAARHGRDLGECLARAVGESRDEEGLVASRYDRKESFKCLSATRNAAYANYRYYPELLEANFLSRDDAEAVIRAREQRGGEAHGMTLFLHDAKLKPPWIDDWPLASYARGLLELGERERFMRALVGHALHAQTRDTFTPYEQVGLAGDPRRAVADYCVPAGLVLPRMLAWSFRYGKYDGTVIEWGGPDPELLERVLAR